MATQAELETAADELAQNPKAMSSDNQSVTEHSLAEIDDHIDRKLNRDAAANGRLGVRFFNMRPPGAVSPLGGT